MVLTSQTYKYRNIVPGVTLDQTVETINTSASNKLNPTFILYLLYKLKTSGSSHQVSLKFSLKLL